MEILNIDAGLDIHGPKIGVPSLDIHEPTIDAGIDIKKPKLDIPGNGLDIHGPKIDAGIDIDGPKIGVPSLDLHGPLLMFHHLIFTDLKLMLELDYQMLIYMDLK